MLKAVVAASSSAGPVSATTVTASSLTTGRFVLTSTGGLLVDSANYTYSGSTATYVGPLVMSAGGSAGNPALAVLNANTGWYSTGSGTNLIAAVGGGAVALFSSLGCILPGAGSAGTADLGRTGTGWGRLYIDYTITPAATTGNRTINKAAGSIRIAAAGTSVTLTNSLITANSIVMATLATVDTTAKSVSAVPSSTSCLFTLNAAAGAEVEIRWFVVSTD